MTILSNCSEYMDHEEDVSTIDSRSCTCTCTFSRCRLLDVVSVQRYKRLFGVVTVKKHAIEFNTSDQLALIVGVEHGIQ